MISAGLFSGIGGLELGLENAGFKPALLCDIDPAARAVLTHRFDAPCEPDVRALVDLPQCDVLTAGFPCQDLSQAGRTSGLSGQSSGLVSEVFRLLDGCGRPPTWVVLENVPFMLRLAGGSAIRTITRCFEDRGYAWAYRTIDPRGFGIPQRRPRVFIVASKTADPAAALFEAEGYPPPTIKFANQPCGFYWTEGRTGVGWAVDAVPPLKGGSTIGIPSPPAIWWPAQSRIATPAIEDAERLQGFSPGWTIAAENVGVKNGRWRLVGNAVNVAVATWVGKRLLSETASGQIHCSPLNEKSWPSAAFGSAGGERFTAHVTAFPNRPDTPGLDEFLQFAPKPLSERATAGFYQRATSSGLSFEPGFLSALEAYLACVRTAA